MGGDRADEEPTASDGESPAGSDAPPDPDRPEAVDGGTTDERPEEGDPDGASADDAPDDEPTRDDPATDDEQVTGGGGESSADGPVDLDDAEESGEDTDAEDSDVDIDAEEPVENPDVEESGEDTEETADGDGDGGSVHEGADAAGAVETPDETGSDPASEDHAMEVPEPPEIQAEDDEDDGGLLSAPNTDEEMPLTAHIEEMVKRLGVVIAIAGLVSLVTFPFAEMVINFLWDNIMPGVPGDITRPRLYGVLEFMFTKLKVASLAGLIIALPVLVYETYQFMRPGLYPNERRYYLAAIPTSLVLALVGVSFAYFVVLPAIFTYFLYYSQDVATIGFALGRTFNLILVLMGYLALVFQIPLFLMLAMMMGIVTRRWLAERRLLFWGAFLGISFLFSPDPTGMAPVVIALTMVVLFEGTLLLTKWTGRG